MVYYVPYALWKGVVGGSGGRASERQVDKEKVRETEPEEYR